MVHLACEQRSYEELEAENEELKQRLANARAAVDRATAAIFA